MTGTPQPGGLAVVETRGATAAGVTAKGGRLLPPDRRAGLLPFGRGSSILFSAPFLMLFALFFLFPLAYAIYLSLFVYRGGVSRFVGIQNYTTALSDPSFWRGMGTIALFGILQAIFVQLFALILALALDSPVVKGRAVFRVVYFLPFAFPGVVAALVWGFLYSPSLDPALRAFGPGFEPLGPRFLLLAIVNIVVWGTSGYVMTMFYASLTSIPIELYDAARIDGCGELALAVRIKIPMIREMVLFTTILSIIGAIQLINEPYLLSSLTNVPLDYTPNLYVFNMAFQFQNFNYAATLSVILAAITLAASLIFIGVTRHVARADERVAARSRPLAATNSVGV